MLSENTDLAPAAQHPVRSAHGQQLITHTQLLDLFPALADRLSHRGDQLSGGEQQMLAPAVTADLASTLNILIDGGLAVLFAEPQLTLAFDVADVVSVLWDRTIAADLCDLRCAPRPPDRHQHARPCQPMSRQPPPQPGGNPARERPPSRGEARRSQPPRSHHSGARCRSKSLLRHRGHPVGAARPGYAPPTAASQTYLVNGEMHPVIPEILDDRPRDAAWHDDLMRQHWKGVYRMLLRKCFVRSDAEDLTQVTMLTAWARRDIVPTDPGPWLVVVAHNHFRNYTRSVLLRHRWSAKIPTYDVPDDNPPPAFVNDAVAAALARFEVREILDQLSVHDAQLLRLIYLQDRSPQDVSSLLGIDERALRTRLSRACKRAHAQWTPDRAGSPARTPDRRRSKTQRVDDKASAPSSAQASTPSTASPEPQGDHPGGPS